MATINDPYWRTELERMRREENLQRLREMQEEFDRFFADPDDFDDEDGAEELEDD
jgi:hypothetical protein